ncbi:hypothetical protein AB0J55_36675 [Amycolatopsis sp. NPDC049688]|uniref:hypothetical protein n=1 Tax=Amycolatopsis sp. NPDC049688 TaxID=3154733 RepID=UPI0034475C01
MRFRRNEIVEWLRETGRGNNPDADLDAPAWSTPDGASLEDLVTLLCLRSATGEELGELEHDDLVDMAEEIDPDDGYLLREVRAMSDVRPNARYVDDLAEASRGPTEALDRLECSRTARQRPTRELTDIAIDLIRTVAVGCARNLSPTRVPLVHAGGSHQLALALGTEFMELVVPESEQAANTRGLLRRAMIRGIETGADEPPGPSVHLRSVVGSNPGAVFGEIEYVIDGLAGQSVALILGPASLLCDELSGDAEKERAELVRRGTLVFAARLPRGLWKEAHRQALGLWVCVGHTDAPLRVTDIDKLDDLEPDDVASDVVAALNDDTSRAFRYARLRERRAVLAKQAVVPQGTKAVRLVTTEPADHRDRVTAVTQRTAEPVPGFDVHVSSTAAHISVAWSSLGQLKTQRLLSIKRGRRYDQDDHDPLGTVHVVDGTGPTGIRLDAIDAAQRHQHATRTEPGDVVYQSQKRPAAWVDPIGGALLCAPARIIRLARGAGVGPHTLAAIINRLPEQAGDPLSWNVPQLTHNLRELDDALAAATTYEAQLHDRLDALRDLTGCLIDAVAEGALTIADRSYNRGRRNEDASPQEDGTVGAVDDEGTQGHALEGR